MSVKCFIKKKKSSLSKLITVALAFESKLLLTQSMAALLFDGFQEQQRAFALLCVCVFFFLTGGSII